MSKEIKKLIIDEFKKIQKKFNDEYPGEIITRNYYTTNSKYGYKYASHFKTFGELKELSSGKDEKTLDNDKKIFILNKEINNLKSEKNKLLEKTILEDQVLTKFEECINDISFDSLKIDNSIDETIFLEKKAMFNISDWHVGEVVNKDEMLSINEYNKEIFIERMDLVFSRLIAYCKKIDVKDIIINSLGDILCGMIQEDNEKTQDLDIIESLFFCQEYIVRKLIELSKHFNKIKINFLIGNHGRIVNVGSKKPFFKKKAQLNWEYVLGKNIQTIFNLIENTKITINVPKSAFIIEEVNGTKFLLLHGDIMSGAGSGGFAGIPLYSLASSSAKFYGVLSHIGLEPDQHPFKHIIMGHYHTSSQIPIFNGGKLWINGCICGETEFSLMKIKSKAMIEQLLLLIDDDGKIDGEINIRGLK
jgi:hypothetical protein